MLKSQAIACGSETTSASTLLARSASTFTTRAIFLAAGSPASRAGRIEMAPRGGSGRSAPQIVSIGFAATATSSPPMFSIAAVSRPVDVL